MPATQLRSRLQSLLARRGSASGFARREASGDAAPSAGNSPTTSFSNWRTTKAPPSDKWDPPAGARESGRPWQRPGTAGLDATKQQKTWNSKSRPPLRAVPSVPHLPPIRSRSSPSYTAKARPVTVDTTTARTTLEYTKPPDLQFKDVEWLPKPLLDAVTKTMKLETCTPVQAALLSRLPFDNDALVQARTGTGKTLAFLLPCLALASKHSNVTNTCHALILSPTRELALQIAAEAAPLADAAGISVHCLIGGDNRMRQALGMQRRPMHVIIATPGRLEDFIRSDHRVMFALSRCSVTVLDEADMMLEIGFREKLDYIFSKLPRKTCQTLTFSATYPSKVDEFVRGTLRPEYKVINAIPPDETRTVNSVAQYQHIGSIMSNLILLHNVLARGEAVNASSTSSDSSTGSKKKKAPKIVVFLPTTAMIALVDSVLRNTGLRNLFSLYGSLVQSVRTRTSLAYRDADCGALLSTDVSARGMNYPGIDLVVQFGSPLALDTYVHRVGRTARAGSSGEAMMLVPNCEAPVVKKWTSTMPIRDIDLHEESKAPKLASLPDSDAPKITMEESAAAIAKALQFVDSHTVQMALSSLNSFYTSQIPRFPKTSKYAPLPFAAELEEFDTALLKNTRKTRFTL